MTEPVKNHPCDACGQLDDHPMIHVWGPWQKDERITVADPSFHFDCIPDDLIEKYGLVEGAPQHSVTVSAIAAARSGVHGADLREYIASLPSDNDIEVGG